MTKKDYVKIAKIVKDNSKIVVFDNGTNANIVNKKILIDELCDMFKEDNSLFSRDRFIDACYDDDE